MSSIDSRGLGMPLPRDPLARLRARLAREGLHIVLPLGTREFDEVTRPLGAALLGDLMEGARGALLVGDGGPAFFARFQASLGRPADNDLEPPETAEPLDAYTRRVLRAALADAKTDDKTDDKTNEMSPRDREIDYRIFYPFVNARPTLPFQRLGEAGGLPAPGPLGIQIHPRYGPWWAYRGLIAVSIPLAAEPTLPASCPTCPHPCVAACPVGAVDVQGFSYERCGDHRTESRRGSPDGPHGSGECRLSCAARLACPVGEAHRYPEHQLAFHMRASLGLARISS